MDVLNGLFHHDAHQAASLDGGQHPGIGFWAQDSSRCMRSTAAPEGALRTIARIGSLVGTSCRVAPRIRSAGGIDVVTTLRIHSARRAESVTARETSFSW